MKNKKGFFVVLDGIDGAGKATQTQILLKRLKEAGRETGTLDFPRYYDNFFGKMVGRYLSGEFESPDPHLASVLYALDRWESKERIEKELAAGKVFVCDRYASANMIHQGGRIENPRKRKELMEYLDEMEFKVLGIPRPDLVIYLDVSPMVGQKLVDKKSSRAYNQGKKRDILEKDTQHLINARKQALRLVKADPSWVKIDCMDGKAIMKPDEIGEMVWRELTARMG